MGIRSSKPRGIMEAWAEVSSGMESWSWIGGGCFRELESEFCSSLVIVLWTNFRLNGTCVLFSIGSDDFMVEYFDLMFD